MVQEHQERSGPARSTVFTPKLIVIIVGTILAVLVVAIVVGLLFGMDTVLYRDLPLNAVVEIAGIIITVFVIEEYIREQEYKRQQEDRALEREREKREQKRERERWIPARQSMYADLLDAVNAFLWNITPPRVCGCAPRLA